MEKFKKSDPLLKKVFVAPCKVIQNAESVELFSGGIRNPGLWNLELGWRILTPAYDWNESGIQVLLAKNPVQEPIRSCPDPVPGIRNPQLGIQSPSSTDKDWNLVPGIRNPQRRIENPRLSWVTLHGAISVNVRSCSWWLQKFFDLIDNWDNSYGNRLYFTLLYVKDSYRIKFRREGIDR